jgi:hypothetical protein
MTMAKLLMTNKCTSSTSCFDGHGGALEQYRQHHLMRHVQGYSGSHWMLPSGDYLVCIAPAAARATGKQKTINKYTYKAGPLLMAMAMRRYVTACIAQWWRSRASLEATGRHHRVSIMSDKIKGTWLHQFFYVFHRQNRRKRLRANAKTPVFNRGLTYQTKEKGLTKVSI